MTANVTIELVENSMRGRAPRKYTNQTAHIKHEASTRVRSTDGFISVGNHPLTVEWVGGLLADFEGVKYKQGRHHSKDDYFFLSPIRFAAVYRLTDTGPIGGSA